MFYLFSLVTYLFTFRRRRTERVRVKHGLRRCR